MAVFLLVPGAGGAAWYWHRVTPLLQAAGHSAIAIDLPADDENAGLSVYADRVIATAGGRKNVVLVSQSLAGGPSGERAMCRRDDALRFQCCAYTRTQVS